MIVTAEMRGKMSGKLYLCATPIGNLEDITFRVVRTLKEVDLIAAEDTRHSIKLLNYFEITTPMTSYHEFNKIEKAKLLVKKLEEGTNIALVTDAGTPGISDPGEELVRQALEANIEVTSLPGACAAITALTISGKATRRFSFEAFLPTDKKERKRILDEMANDTHTLIVYEAPHRLVKTLVELREALGNRKVSIIKELTKKFESVKLTDFDTAIVEYETEEPKGEYVLVIEGRDYGDIVKERQEGFLELSMKEHMEMYLEQGNDKKTAMKLVAKDRGISKRDVYQILLDEE